MKKFAGYFVAFALSMMLSIGGVNICNYFSNLGKTAKAEPKVEIQMSSRAQDEKPHTDALKFSKVHAEEEFSVFKISLIGSQPQNLKEFWQFMQQDCHDECRSVLQGYCQAEIEIEPSDDKLSIYIICRHSLTNVDQVDKHAFSWMLHRYTKFNQKNHEKKRIDMNPNISIEYEFCCH